MEAKAVSDKVLRQIEDWKRRLVDLTRRNRLIFFRETKSSTLEIVEPSPTTCLDRLVLQEKSWHFFVPESEDERVEDNQEDAGEGTPGSEIPLSLARPAAHELLVAPRFLPRITKILRNLHQRSESDLQERGVRILYLALGTLVWREVDDSRTIRSPLILVPVKLDRKSARDPFILSPVDEDIVLNPALAAKLLNDFRIALPPIPEDWVETTQFELLSSVRQLVKPLGWTVEDSCCLSLFSFHKLVMFQDLTKNSAFIGSNVLVNSLADQSPIGDASGGPPVDPAELDTMVPPSESRLVVDADSSQLACIESVKRGTTLLVEGPPGTGKSQTITNIMAESIAAGKKVLFVSEKMAALEVVYKRMRAAQLGKYCLELHSQKANKREVVKELYATYQDSLQPSGGMTPLEFSQLEQRRKDLNGYVTELHQKRDPLEISAFQGLGEIAFRSAYPDIPCSFGKPNELTPLLFDDFRRLATRLSKVWQVAIDRDRHPWYGCGIRDFTSEIRFQLETAIGRNDESLRQLRDRAGELAGSLGLQQPSDVTAVKRTLAIGTILGSSSINPDWIATTGLDETIAAAHRLSDLASNIQANVTYFQQLYEPDVFSLPVDFADRVRESLDRASAVFGPDIRRMPKVLDLADHTLAWAHHAIQAVRSVDQPARTIETLLGLDGAPNLTDLRRHSRLASLCLESARPDEGWLTTDRLEKAAMTVPSYRDKVTRRNTLRQSLLESYEPILFEMNLDAVRSDLITRFGTPLRWFKPGFYRLRSRIKLCRRDRRYPSQTLLADVDRAREVAALEGHCRAVAADVRQVLGAWYREYETEFEKVFRAMSVAKEILSLTRGSPPSALVASARLGQQPSLALINSATSLSRILSEYDGQPCPLPARAAELLESTTLSNLAAFAERLISVTTPLRRVLDAVQSLRTDSMPMSADDLLSDLDRLKSLQLDRREFEDVAADASARLGSRFTGLSSDWAALEESLASAEALVGHLAGAPPPREILSLCVKGPGAAPSLDPLARAFATFNRSRDAFTALFRGGDESAREPLNSEDFELHADQIISRRTRIDDLRDWIDFRQLEVDFLNAGLSDSFAALVGIPALPADAVVPTLEKGIYRRWLNATIDGIPALRQFRTEDHHQMLTEFRHLDQKLVRTGTGRVIAALEARNPGGRAATRGGEVSILLREANKKKRHMPIRRLFENIPTLVADLKPCLLMSPLSVAQFVGARQQFDLVIFDEASQICSEDAVGAIARGRQLVVCGDSKQLPPTSFFNQGDLEFDGDQPEDERFDVYESILDQCRTIGIHPMTLRWHYRSRHESLIAFSNRWFYDNKLVTFPSPISANEDLGVSLKLVPNGIFDRGGKADNPIEADEVVNEVLKHFRLRPTKSLGVVAFSVAQREAIADRLELKLRENPTLTEWFSGDRLETCFVKNLESVQGDERDVIIFSIGYGRDKQGRLTMNFGPLNWDGGQRRLNVAITRAREKVIVVSSISASDFKISETLRPGVLALYRYLDYAERGVEALELDLSLSQGAPDSPLEESVAGAIRELGYEVVPQVGCSKYRIDIGVLAPDRPGNFILGVECDGATYHSSYTARDRDRLRQYALESLGWRIHRIWGPDWVSRRHTETQKLRASIESALVSHHERRSDHRRPLAPVEEIVIRKVARPQPDVTSANTSSWAFPYRVCSIKTDPPRNLEFHDPASSSNLRQMMLEVLATESPIHIDLLIRRLADRWGLQRIGDRMRKAAERALAQLRRADPSIRKNGDVVTRLEDDSAIEVRQPVDGEPETIRRIELVPPEEIAEAIRHLIRDAFSLSETDVVAQVARIFGFDRTGSIIRETVSKILNDLREKGSVQESDGRLTARDAN